MPDTGLSDFSFLFGMDGVAPRGDFEDQVQHWMLGPHMPALDRRVGVRVGALQMAQLAPDPEARLAFLGDLLFSTKWRRIDVPRLQRAARSAEVLSVVLCGLDPAQAAELNVALAELPCFLGALQLNPQSPIHQRFIYDSVSPRFWWDDGIPESVFEGPFDDATRLSA